jgi:8-oxo-dGTP pyrophosphatase MutT (NUDIX family)
VNRVHRKPLLQLLQRHLARRPCDRERVEQMREFVRAHPDCFERDNRVGHVTGSAWIVSADHARFLLTHHRKLGRWLQLGGHADGDPEPARVALREAREESGMHELAFVAGGGVPLPLDVDIHAIPAARGEPAHLHHDVRFLLVAAPGQPLRPNSESHELRWFPCERARELLDEPSTRRMAERALRLLRSGPELLRTP